jgi:hypothetical protein
MQRLIASSAFILMGLLLGACASNRPDTQLRDSLANDMTSREVPKATVEKVRQGASLTTGDMAEALKAGVPEAPLISYVKDTGATYTMTPAAVRYLTECGASDSFTEYLLQTKKNDPPQADVSDFNPKPGDSDYYRPTPNPAAYPSSPHGN